MRFVCADVRAGDAVYGLYRVDAVRRAGGFRRVLYADRLLLAEVALTGSVEHVPEVLWYRRPTARFSKARQRRASFPGRPPLHTWLPWPLVHGAAVAWAGGVRGAYRPLVGRRRAVAAAVAYVATSVAVAVESKREILSREHRRRAKRRRRRGSRSSVRARIVRRFTR
jgi:hypothetical protein